MTKKYEFRVISSDFRMQYFSSIINFSKYLHFVWLASLPLRNSPCLPNALPLTRSISVYVIVHFLDMFMDLQNNGSGLCAPKNC